MNKKELAELAKADSVGKAVAVGSFVGIEGVDKSVDRELLLDVVARHMDRLGLPSGTGGKTVFEQILESVPNIILTLAKNGYLTPEEIRRSKACNQFFKRALEDVEQQEEREATARRDALDAIERAKAEAAAIATKVRGAAAAIGSEVAGDEGVPECDECCEQS